MKFALAVAQGFGQSKTNLDDRISNVMRLVGHLMEPPIVRYFFEGQDFQR
jgi:hypothetical protein